MIFQTFHVNPGEKLKKKDVNNDLSNFMSVFPTCHTVQKLEKNTLQFSRCRALFDKGFRKGIFTPREKIISAFDAVIIDSHEYDNLFFY